MTGTLWRARAVMGFWALLAAGLPAERSTTEAAAPSAKLDFKLPKSTTLGPKPDGSKVRVTPSLTPARGVRTARLMLRDTSYTASAVLDQWLDLSELGRHTLDVEFRGSVRIDGGDPAGLKRTTRLVIDVKPRDAAQLEKRGADWLKQISNVIARQ